MKNLFFLAFVMLRAVFVYSQSYDSALKYLISSSSFQEAMNHFIAESSADPADTGEEPVSAVLARRKEWMSGRISNDVSMGADIFLSSPCLSQRTRGQSGL